MASRRFVTVAQLIAALESVSPTAEVIVSYDCGGAETPIREVIVSAERVELKGD